MNPAGQLAIKGAIIGSLLVGILGFRITAGASFPPAEELPALSTAAGHEVRQISNRTYKQNGSPEINTDIRDCQVSQKFPKRILKWCDLITTYAQKQNLPPDLVAAMIWQESGGNPEAYSRSGAVGLMQIMPRDGLSASFQCSSGPCFANRPTMEQLKDPQFNLQYGTRMLANLIQKHKATREALRAYGPMGVGYSYADKVLDIYKQYGDR
jgi:hypothetical protein